SRPASGPPGSTPRTGGSSAGHATAPPTAGPTGRTTSAASGTWASSPPATGDDRLAHHGDTAAGSAPRASPTAPPPPASPATPRCAALQVPSSPHPRTSVHDVVVPCPWSASVLKIDVRPL